MYSNMKISTNTKIFILEDDDFMRGLLMRKFQADGAIVEANNQAAGAFEAIKKMMPDITILDIMIPGEIDGLEILRQMRADPQTRDLKVMMLSNLSEKANLDKANKLGVSSYLVKSTVTVEGIATEVARALEAIS